MNEGAVLNQIWELGFILINNGSSYPPQSSKIVLDNGIHINFVKPMFTVHKDRVQQVMDYLKDKLSLLDGESAIKYLNGSKTECDIPLESFFTVYDGWREHSEPSAKPMFIEANNELLQFYKGQGSAGEPGRFIQPYELKDIFPIFKFPVMSMGRHKNDSSVYLIPDTDFIKSKGYIELRDEISQKDKVSWDNKIEKIHWRGGLHGPALKAYDPNKSKPRKQRQIAVDFSEGIFNPFLDAKASYTTGKEEMLKYKYLLDIDGEVNAWSALFWKLLSTSVVFKVDSHWEQWYYKDLKEWVHYIPVKGDLSDLKVKFEWAKSHDKECQEISKNATKFAQNLSY